MLGKALSCKAVCGGWQITILVVTLSPPPHLLAFTSPQLRGAPVGLTAAWGQAQQSQSSQGRTQQLHLQGPCPWLVAAISAGKQNLFFCPPLFLSGHRAHENDAGFAHSCGTHSLYHWQQDSCPLGDPLRPALSSGGTRPIYILSCPEKGNCPGGLSPAHQGKPPGTSILCLPFLGQQR